MQYFTRFRAFPNSGRIYIMDGYTKQSDHNDLMSIARYYAKQGKIVQITSSVHYKDAKYKHVFGKLIGTIYEGKCPDLIIDGEFYEYESFLPPFTKQKIFSMVSKGSQQASRIIINNNKGAAARFILANIHHRLRDKTFTKNIDEVWFYDKGKVQLVFKMQ